MGKVEKHWFEGKTQRFNGVNGLGKALGDMINDNFTPLQKY
jgi:hypothetical protein